MSKDLNNMLLRDDFNGFDYETTLKYFKYTRSNPQDVRNGETRGEWFKRCHGITGKEFAEIIKQKEAEHVEKKRTNRA